MKKNNIFNLTTVSLMIALVVISTKIEIRIADFRFHLGNSMCLLSAFILSPFYGGLSAGLGSMLYDILFYNEGVGCIITFITKFFMGFTASLFYNKFYKEKANKISSIIFSGAVGQITYIILYMIKTFVEQKLILNLPMDALVYVVFGKFSISVLNAVMAVIISTIVYLCLIKNKIINK